MSAARNQQARLSFSEPSAPSPTSALQLDEKWLDLILDGRKVWEIYSRATVEREHIALAQIGAGVLRGEVDIVDRKEVPKDAFAQHECKHHVPPHEQDAVIGQYVRIYAWHLARPRRYATPIAYTRKHGAVGFVDLSQQQHIFDCLRSARRGESTDDSFQAVSAARCALVTSCSRLDVKVPPSTPPSAADRAADAADRRATATAQRGAGDVRHVTQMQEAAARAQATGTDDYFGANRTPQLRERLRRSRPSTRSRPALPRLRPRHPLPKQVRRPIPRQKVPVRRNKALPLTHKQQTQTLRHSRLRKNLACSSRHYVTHL